jgi:hypothetical protein
MKWIKTYLNSGPRYKKEIDVMPEKDWYLIVSNLCGAVLVIWKWNDIRYMRYVAISTLIFYTVFIYVILYKTNRIVVDELEKAKGQWEN